MILCLIFRPMNLKVVILSLSVVAGAMSAKGQVPTPHSSPEARAKMKAKQDYAAFRKEITALKEFADEKAKIKALQKENRVIVRVIPTIDSVEADDDAQAKTLTGYITQVVGDNTANAYEIQFDRATRKITAVKRTADAIEPEEEAKVKPAVKKTTTTTTTTTKTTTKKKDGDEEEEGEEE